MSPVLPLQDQEHTSHHLSEVLWSLHCLLTLKCLSQTPQAPEHSAIHLGEH